MEDIVSALEDAQRVLAPLFGIEGKLQFELDDDSEESGIEDVEDLSNYEINEIELLQKSYLMEVSWNGRFLRYDKLKKDTIPELVGNFVGRYLYEFKNPYFHAAESAWRRKFREETRKRREDSKPEGFLSAMGSSEGKIFDEYNLLKGVLSYCSGFAYAAVKKGKGYVPSLRESTETMGAYILEWAALQLYQKKGCGIISELAPLRFEEARAIILDQISYDLRQAHAKVN